MFWSKKSETQSGYQATLIKLATSPATLNVSMLMDDARNILGRYLGAVYAQRTDLLPVDGMEENLYYRTFKIMEGKVIRKPTEVILGDFELCDYDRSKMYMVQRITYRATYSLQEIGKVGEKVEVIADYQYDERLGWLLAKIDSTMPDCGRNQTEQRA